MIGFFNASLSKNVSSRGKLTVAIGLVLLVGFLLSNGINYQISANSLRQAMVDQELPLTSNNIYSEIQRDLLQPVFVASLMANDTFVKDWLVSGEEDSGAITRYLDGIRREYGLFTSFLVSDRTRNYYHFSGVSQVVRPDDPRDAWYFRVAAMEQDFELNVDLNAEQDDVMTVFINHRIKDYNGDYIAVTGVGLELRSLYDIVDRYEQQFGRHIYFVDEDGDIILKSDNALVEGGSIFDDPAMAGVADQIITKDHGFFQYNRNGAAILTNSRLIPELGWHVIVELEETHMLAPLRRSLMLSSIVGLMVILVTLVLVGAIVNMFHRKLEYMATTDRLTGIGNRQVFEHDLSQALARYKRDQGAMSVILADLDHFKRINDRYGHLVGDAVLKRVTSIMQERIRASDSLCRWGGEEIVILTPDCDIDEAMQLSESIRLAIEAGCLDLLDGTRPVTASFGVAAAEDRDTADSLMDRADAALYRAKHAGRNRVARDDGVTSAVAE